MSEIAKKIEARGFIVHEFETAQEAAAFVAETIPAGKSVGIGGSVTVRTLALDKTLAAKGCEVYWHWTAEDKRAALLNAQTADYYLASANAIDESGVIYNIDGNGNRIGSLMFGRAEAFIIAGKNKLVAGGEKEAIERIKTKACGPNARRLGLKTPCSVNDCCIGPEGCKSPDRMCKLTSIMERVPGGKKVHVVLVNEELGY